MCLLFVSELCINIHVKHSSNLHHYYVKTFYGLWENGITEIAAGDFYCFIFLTDEFSLCDLGV